MNQYVELAITVICAVIASSGFWAFLQNRTSKKDNRTKLLVGLAHDRITFLGQKYIDRGWITTDDYENLVEYLFEPYKACGGDGTAEKIMNEVKKLPMKRGDNHAAD